MVYAPFFFPEQEWIRCQPEFSPSLLTRSDPVAMPTILPPLTDNPQQRDSHGVHHHAQIIASMYHHSRLHWY